MAETKMNHHSLRILELENQYHSLEPQIEDSPVKKAISVLHGMIQQSWRSQQSSSVSLPTTDKTLQDIAAMYRHAPKMQGEAVNQPLPVHTPAPDFALMDASGKTVKLSDFRGKKVMLVFYPLDWSPGCSQQLDLYQSELSEFEKRGVQLIGISVDSIYSHGAWAAVRGIHFPLLSDFNPKGEVARKYHVYRNKDGFSERALYLIDEQGVIQYRYISPYLHHIPDIYQLLHTLDELKTLPDLV